MERNRKKRILITVDFCRNIRIYLDIQKSIKEIFRITDVSYNSVLPIANKIRNGMFDNDICKTRKGRKINEETHLMSRLEALLNEDNSLTQKRMRESLKI